MAERAVWKRRRKSTARLRREAVEQLGLRPGKRALALGCGTGLSLPLLAEKVGPEGLVLGVEISPEMLAEAKGKVEKGGLQRVRLIEADAERFDLPEERLLGSLYLVQATRRA